MKSIIFLLLLITISCSCNSSDKDETPIEIPITEYSLIGTSCQWANLKSNEVIIVNSKSELEKYVNCNVEILPGIDFSKNTLLLVSGSTSSNIVEIQTKLTKHNNYVLNVDVYVGILGVAPVWYVAILSPQKIKSNVKLNYKQIDFFEK